MWIVFSWLRKSFNCRILWEKESAKRIYRTGDILWHVQLLSTFMRHGTGYTWPCRIALRLQTRMKQQTDATMQSCERHAQSFKADFNITFCEAGRFNFRRYVRRKVSPNEMYVPVNTDVPSTKGAGIQISCRVTTAPSDCQTDAITTMLSSLMKSVISVLRTMCNFWTDKHYWRERGLIDSRTECSISASVCYLMTPFQLQVTCIECTKTLT